MALRQQDGFREELWATGRTAGALGVAPTTVQRWADEGRLPSVRTVGGHRRFRPSDVEALRRSLEGRAAAAEVWADLLVARADPYRLQAALLGSRARSGSWAPVADELGAGLDELGRRWERQDCSVFEEHLASERLARALARCGELIPVGPGAPACLLLTAEGEEHTLGLSLVELVAREAGWRCDWLGRRTPFGEVERAVKSLRPPLVGVSASSYLAAPGPLRRQAETLGAICRPAGVELVLGGNGAWPDEPPFGRRMKSLQELIRFLRTLEGAR